MNDGSDYHQTKSPLTDIDGHKNSVTQYKKKAVLFKISKSINNKKVWKRHTRFLTNHIIKANTYFLGVGQNSYFYFKHINKQNKAAQCICVNLK